MILSNNETIRISKKFNLPSGSDDEDDLGLSIDVEVSVLLGCSLGIDKISVLLLILSGVLLGIIGSSLSGSCTILFGGSTGFSTGLKELGVSGLLLQNVLWDNSCPKQNTKT